MAKNLSIQPKLKYKDHTGQWTALEKMNSCNNTHKNNGNNSNVEYLYMEEGKYNLDHDHIYTTNLYSHLLFWSKYAIGCK